MASFCRACLVTCEKPTDLLQYTEKNRRLYVYSTGLQVKKTDTFPFQLCQECYINMKLACKFKKQCRFSEKKLNNYLTLKECGEVTDIATYLKNNDEFLTIKFPNINGYGTPISPMQKSSINDNESTNTSIRNFVLDLLHPDEIQDTEARIIKEVIQEDADILDDSLDSHWLQDDISIDTDFRFSPFATPRPDQISKTPNCIQINSSPRAKSDRQVNINNESFIAAKKQLLYSTPAADIVVKIENVDDDDLIEENTEEEIIKDLDLLDGLVKKDAIDNNLEQAINTANADRISLSEILGSPRSIPALINSNDVESISLTEILAAQDPICPSGGSTPAAINSTNNIKMYSKELIATPRICPGASGASTPTIANILFGDKLELQGENCVPQKTGYVIGSHENVEGSEEDILKDFFDKQTGKYIGELKAQVPEIFEIDSNYDGKENGNVQNTVNMNSIKRNAELKREHVGKRPELMGKSKYDLSNLSCKICDKTYKNTRVLKLHLSKIHKLKLPKIRTKEPLKELPCEYCGKIFKRRSNLIPHVKRHLKLTKVYKCEYCSLECGTEARMRMHMTTHIGKEALKPRDKIHVCHLCGHCSGSKSNLQDHISTHNKVYKFECDTCHRKFSKKHELVRHIRCHDVLRKNHFKCTQCGKYFTRRDALSRHLKVHNKERKFQCIFCNTTSITSAGLKHHMKTKKCLKMRQQNDGAVELDQNKEPDALNLIVLETLDEMDIEVITEENETVEQSEDQPAEETYVTDNSGLRELLSLL